MPPAETKNALLDEELDQFFAPLNSAAGAALAVSGGADSLALLDGAQRWQRRHTGVALTVLTVDHGLRAGSADEAQMVAQISRRRGLPCQLLKWETPPPHSDIESAARTARYRLLLEATRAIAASHLVLAHHRDDVAEALLMRLARGAGVFGLASMRPAIEAGGITILRPFLAVPKARLVATARAAGLVAVDDPMNRDKRFTRARMREAMPLLSEQGIDPAGLADAARRLADAADAIDAAASDLIENAVSVDDRAIAHLETASFLAAPAEVRARVLVRILLALGGAVYPPRRDRLTRLLEALASPDHGKRSLSGVVLEHRGEGAVFYRETGRTGLPEISVARGYTGRWDHRFEIRITGAVPEDTVIGPLGEAGRRAIGWRGGITGAVAALPALRSGGSIRAVPSLAWSEGPVLPVAVRQIVADRVRRPPLFPDFG